MLDVFGVVLPTMGMILEGCLRSQASAMLVREVLYLGAISSRVFWIFWRWARRGWLAGMAAPAPKKPPPSGPHESGVMFF